TFASSSLTIRAPPSSTLFPYTTLFRSGQQAQGVLGGRPRLGGVGQEALGRIGGQRERLECQLKVPDDRVVDELDAGGVDPDVVGDRKSTRLNSSHEWISYAVFCLKKKN